jgi:Tir chaperone protein (CesT) family
MAETTVSSHDLVNEWLKALNDGPATEDTALNEDGITAITRGDGEQLVLRLVEDTLSLFIMLLEVAPEGAGELFRVALNLNLYPSQVGGGHLAYDGQANMLTYCAHLPMELLSEERFLDAVGNMFDAADEIRGKFLDAAE